MPRTKGKSKLKNKRKSQESAVKQEQSLPPALHDEPSGPDLINNLNNDCLIEIFQHLSIADRLSIASVCERWRSLSKFAWKNVKRLYFHMYPSSDLYQLPPKSRNNRGVGRLLKKCGVHVKELMLSSPCDSRVMPFVNRYCHNLETMGIFLDHPNWNSKMVFPQLQTVQFFRDVERNRFPEEPLQALPFDSLTEITIHLNNDYYYMQGELPATAATVFKNCTKLTKIHLGYINLQPEVATAIFEKSNLTSLILDSCSLYGGFPHLTYRMNLEYLDFHGTIYVDDSFLKGLPQTCPNLRLINLDECQFTDNGIINFWQLPKLEELYVTKVKDITDAPFANLKNLKSLSCRGCSGVNDDGLMKLISHASNLQILSLTRTSVTEKILRIANQITKERTNNLPLKIFVDEDVKNSWNEEEVSPLLIVEGYPKQNYF